MAAPVSRSSSLSAQSLTSSRLAFNAGQGAQAGSPVERALGVAQKALQQLAPGVKVPQGGSKADQLRFAQDMLKCASAVGSWQGGKGTEDASLVDRLKKLGEQLEALNGRSGPVAQKDAGPKTPPTPPPPHEGGDEDLIGDAVA